MAKKQSAKKKATEERAATKKTVMQKSPAVKVALHVTKQRVNAVKGASKSSSRRAAKPVSNSVEPTIETVSANSPLVQKSAPSGEALQGQSQPACQSEIVQSVSDEERRLRAYLKWEAAGRPDGDGSRFWLEAEQELFHEQALQANQ